MFNEDLTNFLEKAKTEASQNAIMFLDLDRFKYINDTLGHDVGDLLLIEVSRRIENLLKKRHQVQRFIVSVEMNLLFYFHIIMRQIVKLLPKNYWRNLEIAF